MTDIVISAEGLSKRYRLGAAEHRHDTLFEACRSWLTSPLQNLKRLRSLTVFDDDSDQPDVLWALRDVSFAVKRGEVVGIIGRNGAGKSSLLKILSRITEPTTGRAIVVGRVGSLLEVGTGFHPDLTGRENIFLNGAILGMRRAEIRRKFADIVSFAELERFIDTPVKRYSSGMYLRLAFSVAAHLEPEILLVDEVLAVGDAAFQTKCLGKMRDVSHHGRTILFVSHNLPAVSRLCDRVILLDQGKIQTIAAPNVAIDTYLAQDSTFISETNWSCEEKAPGDDRVRLLACRLLQNAAPSSIVDINQPIEIEISFRLLRPASNLITGVSLYNFENTCLFNNCDWTSNSLPAGDYSRKVTIPAHTLAEGIHKVLVQLVFYAPHIPSVVQPNSLIFRALDSDHPDALRGPYKGEWPGMLRIKLQWSKFYPRQINTAHSDSPLPSLNTRA